MEKISGLVLDAQDDINGSVLRSMFPTLDDVPELYKTAAPLSAEQREALPDDAFALILRQGDTTLRKYACIDEGNTALNIGYFLSNYHKLPVEAVKTAAANLQVACHWYDIEPPDELKKLSTGQIPVIGKQQVWKGMDGTTYSNSNQSWGLEKDAEVSGTHIMPSQITKMKVDPSRKRLSAVKTAEQLFEESLEKDAGVGIGVRVSSKDLDERKRYAADVSVGFPHGVGVGVRHKRSGIGAGVGLLGPYVSWSPSALYKTQPESLPQVGRVMKPHVDVTSHEPPKLIEEKKASYYAMPSIQRFPMDGIDQLEKAAEYFYDWQGQMEPADRREYAVNLVKRASALHKPLRQDVYDYGGEGYAKEAQLIAAVDQRALLLRPHADQGTDEQTKQASAYNLGLYNELFAQRRQLPSDVYASTMAEIDKLAGLDEFYGTELEDPWKVTFAKTAEEADPKDAIVIGNSYMNLKELETFARLRSDAIESAFGDDFRSEFQKDPKGIFDSLPVDQKKVIMNMVNTELSLQGASTG